MEVSILNVRTYSLDIARRFAWSRWSKKPLRKSNHRSSFLRYREHPRYSKRNHTKKIIHLSQELLEKHRRQASGVAKTKWLEAHLNPFRPKIRYPPLKRGSLRFVYHLVLEVSNYPDLFSLIDHDFRDPCCSQCDACSCCCHFPPIHIISSL